MINFSIERQDGKARTGLITTAHGAIRTPVFMSVGTAGTVKGMLPEQVRADSPQPVPAGYETSVADYFRRLSRNP